MQRVGISAIVDDASLEGTLYLPEGGDPRAVVMCAHGAAAATRDFFLYKHLAELLTEHRAAVVSYDRRGEGLSTGERGAAFEVLADDLATVVRQVRQKYEGVPLGVWGLSQGGWIGPLCHLRHPGLLSFLIIVSGSGVGPAEQMMFGTRSYLRFLGADEDEIAQVLRARSVIDQYLRGGAERAEAVAAFEAALQLPYELADFLPDPDNPRQWAHIVDFDPLPSLRSVNVPTLLFYGTDDMWVPVGRSIRLWLESLEEAGNTDFAITRLAGTGHLPTLSWSDPLTEEGPIAPMYEELLVGWLRGHGLAR